MKKTIKPNQNNPEAKKKQVTHMFDGISKSYDLLNRIITLGVDIIWRKRVVKLIEKVDHESILDIATGTGDLVLALSKLETEKIIGLDISPGMLEIGKEKVLARKLLEQEKAKQESTSDDHSQDNIDNDDTQDNSNNTKESESSYDDYDDNENTDDNDDTSDDNADIQQSEENTESKDDGEEQSTVGEEGGKVTNKVMPQTVQSAEDNTDKVTYNGKQFLKYFSLQPYLLQGNT